MDPNVVGQAAANKRARRVRDEDLTPVRRRSDPCSAVDLQADVIVAAQLRMAGVDAHPHPHRSAFRPRSGGEAALGVHRRVDRGSRLREHDQERIAFGPPLRSASPGTGGPDDAMVLLEQRGERGRPELLDESSRGFEVREEECDSPGRQDALTHTGRG